MQEELLANQSQEEVVSQESMEQVTHESGQESTDTTPEIPQAFKVKYNKEEVDVPYDQAPDYIQKGLNYDKVSQRATEYQNHLDRVAKLTGYESHDELLAELDALERQREAQRYEEAGISQDKFNELLEQLPEFQQMRQLQQQQEAAAHFEREANEILEMFPDLDLNTLPEDVWSMKEQRGLSLLDAYLRTNYSSLGQQKEQEAIQKLQQNQQLSTGALGREGTDHVTGYSQLSAKDKANLRERVLRGEIVEF